MDRLRLGCIADDFTGATDLASMLVRADLKVVQVFDGRRSVVSLSARLRKSIAEADAVVVALKTRSIPASEAINQSLDALELLQNLGMERLFFKYCSTFDSTSEGNIGPVGEALANSMSATRLIYCPSFPENGRTVYCGHLFVNGRLLHESGMQNHPLNPMTDSNLVRVLTKQSRRPVGLIPLGTQTEVELAGKSDRDVFNWIADAIGNEDLARIANVARNDRILSGGSAIATYWSREIFEQCSQETKSDRKVDQSRLGEKAASPPVVADENRQVAIIVGSCSDTTRQQLRDYREDGVTHFLDGDNSSRDQFCSINVERALRWAREQSNRSSILIGSGLTEDDVLEMVDKFGRNDAAMMIEQTLASIASGLASQGVRRFVVAGGETSGAVLQSLNIRAVHIGREVAAGVPCIFPIDHPIQSLILKSGNFGGQSFFEMPFRCLLPRVIRSKGRQ